MGRYLKLAMTVMSRREPIEQAVVAVGAGVQNQPQLTRKADPRMQHPEVLLAACGSPACAGCYDVGDRKRIHPPKCGHEYLDWLKRWEARGRTQ